MWNSFIERITEIWRNGTMRRKYLWCFYHLVISNVHTFRTCFSLLLLLFSTFLIFISFRVALWSICSVYEILCICIYIYSESFTYIFASDWFSHLFTIMNECFNTWFRRIFCIFISSRRHYNFHLNQSNFQTNRPPHTDDE